MTGAGNSRVRVFAPPREHGAYGVWSASLLFALLASRDFDIPLLVPALLASFIVLFTLDYMRVVKLGGRGPLIIAFVSLLYLPVIVSRAPYSLVLAGLSLALLALTMYSRSLTNVAGAALVGVAGSFVYLAGSEVDWGKMFFPPLYNLLATSQAQIRVTGPRPGVVASEVLGAVGILALGVYFFKAMGTWAPLGLLIVDVVTRFAMRLGGFYDRLELKRYGILEFTRTLLIQALVAILLRTLASGG